MLNKDEEKNFEGIIIPFYLAKLCVEETCDNIFVGDECPICGNKKSLLLSQIIKK